jgi:putative methyltransferase (TIGR04325 family)
VTLRDALRNLAPPLLVRTVRTALRRGLRFEGDLATWEEARAASGGYDSEAVLRRMLEAELKVKKGEAVDARDGVTFGEMQFALPVMAALARVCAIRGGAVRVLDIGGAFGGLYRQYKAFVPGGKASWIVVEQAALVKLGKQHFENEELQFAFSLEEALVASPADIVLLSSVLQYLPQPYALMSRIVASGIPHVVIDRTPCSCLDRDVLSVQRVPPEIYEASYPCWIFSQRRLRAAFAPVYGVLSSHADGSGKWRSSTVEFELAGLILERHP